MRTPCRTNLLFTMSGDQWPTDPKAGGKLLLLRRTDTDQSGTKQPAPHPQSGSTPNDVIPTECRTGTMLGGARRDRTDDLMLAKHALSQLSYGPTFAPYDVGEEPLEMSGANDQNRAVIF